MLDALSDDLTLDLDFERILLELVDNSRYHSDGTIRFGSDNTRYVSHREDERPPAGIHAARFHADGLVAGTSMVRLTAGGFSGTTMTIRLPDHASD